MKTICGDAQEIKLLDGRCVVYTPHGELYWRRRCYLVEKRMDQLEVEIKRLKTKVGE